MRVLCLPLYVLGCITFPAWYAVVCMAEFAATPFNDRWLRWSSDAEYRFKQWGRGLRVPRLSQ